MDQAPFIEPVDQVKTYYSVYKTNQDIDFTLRAYQWLHYEDYENFELALARARSFNRYQIVKCDWLYSGSTLQAIRGQLL